MGCPGQARSGPGCGLPSRLLTADIRRRRRHAELRLQRGDARLQRLVFLARQPRHVLDRLELLALDDVEVAQDFLGLIAQHGIDLALDALGGAGGVVHQSSDLVEKSIAGLGHAKSPLGYALVHRETTMAIRTEPFKAHGSPRRPSCLVMRW